MFIQVQIIISANFYREEDLPDYRMWKECLCAFDGFGPTDDSDSDSGNGKTVLVAVASYNIVLYLLVKAYYVWRNGSKEKQWKQLSLAERQSYYETTASEGNKRLDFRFVH